MNENMIQEIEASPEYAVQMHGITKEFNSFRALDNMNLDVKKGTIHSLLGENGAGKSTLMNVLYGLYTPDEGEIFLEGRKTEMKNPGIAIANGIGMVHQHFMLVDKFTVAQNIILGKEPVKAHLFIDMAEAEKRVEAIADKYGLSVDPRAKISDISVGMQQRTEILKVLYRGAETLILDEPTAVLTPIEIEELLKIMKRLAEDGKTIIIITHKLQEIMKSSDTCTIIRAGKFVSSIPVKDSTEQQLAAMMVGHNVNLAVEKKKARPERTILNINNLTVKNEEGLECIKDLSLQVRAGEIVGIAGIDGNGQKELVEVLDNLKKADEGSICIDGVNIENTATDYGMKHGIGIIPEDRHKDGLILKFNCNENAILEKYRSSEYCKDFFINRKKASEFMNELIREYDIRPENCGKLKASALSGGNQQKIIIGREIANKPKLLIAVQPTRGLDVGAIEIVHRILIQERDKGTAILLISYELSEIMNLSDRIGVIFEGHIDEVVDRADCTQESIGLRMGGGIKA